MKTLIELREDKGRLAEQAGDVLRRARDEKRDPTAEENTKFDTIHEELEAVSATIRRLEKQDALERELEQRDDRRSQHNAIADRRMTAAEKPITERERAEALRAWMLAGTADFDPKPEMRELARRCGLPFEAKRVMINMFAPKALKPTEYVVDGVKVGQRDLDRWQGHVNEERAALTGLQSSTTTGGYTVADEAMRALEVALLAYGGMRQVATIIRTATGGPMPIPTTNDTGNKGEIIGENTTSNELEMTFGQLVLDAWKYSSKYILASIEFMQDTSINAAAFLGDALGTRIARIQNDHFTTGTGSQPNGIVTAATSSGITTAANGTITYDNLVDLEHSIDPAYRVNSAFMLHDSALKLIKKVKALQYSGDTTGVPLWMPGMAAGAPDTILGYPYTINQSMAATGTSSKSVLFGQLNKYIIRDTMQVELRRLDELFAVLGQVAFLAFARSDGDLLDAGTHPVKYMTQGT